MTTELPTRALRWLITGQLLVLAPHAMHQPLWVSTAFVALAAWRLLNSVLGVPLPQRRLGMLWMLKHALAVLALLAVYLDYGAVIGRDAGIALLILLIGLKLIEMRSPREFYLTAFLGFFLLVTLFFHTQTAMVAAYALACVTVLLGSLAIFVDPRPANGTVATLRFVVVLLVQAAPFMVVAFVLFPRPAAPLWQLPKDASAAVAGLSEEMSPGKLSELTLTDSVAFRASFAAAIPPTTELYWRGPVMVTTDGRTWTPGPQVDRATPPITAWGTRYEYSVTLEPTNKPWIYVLEHPSSLPVYGHLTRDLRVMMQRPVSERIRYSAQSYTHTAVMEADWDELRAALQLPPVSHPKARALARQWRTELRTDDAIVQRALAFFRHESFYYTLSPPVIRGDAVDEFLFGTRRGFCEHYAAAFTVLMRAAGIPARVVTGYQGGEYNPVGDYLIVRQRDAHAWSEVWLGRRGWVRVDPTAAVSPARVQHGIDRALSTMVSDAQAADALGSTSVWKRLRYAYDALNNRWNIWVIGYNARRQTALFERFGIHVDRRALAVGFGAAVLLTLALTASMLLRAARVPTDPVRRAYEAFCRKLARRGYVRAPAEGPQDFARRVSALLPRAATDVARITELYAAIRYGRSPSDDSVRSLTNAVRDFSL